MSRRRHVVSFRLNSVERDAVERVVRESGVGSVGEWFRRVLYKEMPELATMELGPEDELSDTELRTADWLNVSPAAYLAAKRAGEGT